MSACRTCADTGTVPAETGSKPEVPCPDHVEPPEGYAHPGTWEPQSIGDVW